MKWKYQKGKVRGGYGQTDFKKKTITVDPKKHRSTKYARKVRDKDGSENMLVTMAHELLHKAHPDWTEKKVEATARAFHKSASRKQKNRIYSKFKK